MARTSSAWLPTTMTTRSQPPAMAASATQRIMGLPRILWETLAWFDFMRVPSPAARMMAVAFAMVCLPFERACNASDDSAGVWSR